MHIGSRASIVVCLKCDLIVFFFVSFLVLCRFRFNIHFRLGICSSLNFSFLIHEYIHPHEQSVSVDLSEYSSSHICVGTRYIYLYTYGLCNRSLSERKGRDTERERGERGGGREIGRLYVGSINYNL